MNAEREIQAHLADAQEVTSIGIIANFGPLPAQGQRVMTLARVPTFDFAGVPQYDSACDTRWAAITTDEHRVGTLELWWPNGTQRKLRFDMESSIGWTLLHSLRTNASNGISTLSITNKKGAEGQVTAIEIEIDRDEVFSLLERLAEHLAAAQKVKDE